MQHLRTAHDTDRPALGEMLEDVLDLSAPSLTTSGETLTIEESMNLEGENGATPECRRRARMELSTVVLPPAAKTSEP